MFVVLVSIIPSSRDWSHMHFICMYHCSMYVSITRLHRLTTTIMSGWQSEASCQEHQLFALLNLRNIITNMGPSKLSPSIQQSSFSTQTTSHYILVISFFIFSKLIYVGILKITPPSSRNPTKALVSAKLFRPRWLVLPLIIPTEYYHVFFFHWFKSVISCDFQQATTISLLNPIVLHQESCCPIISSYELYILS